MTNNTLKISLLFLTFICLFGCETEKPKTKTSLASKILNVEIYIAKNKPVLKEYKTAGELNALNSLLIKSEIAGKIQKIYVKDGQKIKKNALIVKLDDSELQAEKKQTEILWKAAKQNLDRIKKLHESGSATDVDLENAETEFDKTEASLELLKVQISKTEIRAPFSGTCSFLNVRPGEWISAGTSIVSFADVSELRIRFSLPQRYAMQIQKGETVFITDTENNISGEGIIRALSPELSKNSRTRTIEALLNNKNSTWLSGSFVSLTVPLSKNTFSGISIPAEAITLDDKGAYVFVVKNSKAKKTYVETSLRTPISVVITSGLSEGDSVAVSGLMNLKEGSAIKVKSIRNNDTYEITP